MQELLLCTTTCTGWVSGGQGKVEATIYQASKQRCRPPRHEVKRGDCGFTAAVGNESAWYSQGRCITTFFTCSA